MNRKRSRWLAGPLLLAPVLALLLAPGAHGGEPPPQAETVPPKQPSSDLAHARHESEGFFSFGYSWRQSGDPSTQGEHESLSSSPVGALWLDSFPLPHRYHLNFDYRGEDDFYGDAGYAYRDLVLFRDILRSAPHNQSALPWSYPGSPPFLLYTDLSGEETLQSDLFHNQLSLRLKAPDFPFHLFLHHRYLEKSGEMQQRFLLGSFSSFDLTSERRRLDWQSHALTLGANSHLGPLEVEYTNTLSRFDTGNDGALHAFYPQPYPGGRPADVYPHNVLPETESFANSLKTHTSYTGSLVASASLSGESTRNNYSGARSFLWHTAGDLQWLPMPELGVFLRYRHRELDFDQPTLVTLTGLAGSTSYASRAAPDSQRDSFSLSARYRPLRRLTLVPEYRFSRLNRQNAEEWNTLAGRTDQHLLLLTTTARPMDSLQLKAVIEGVLVDGPGTNTEADRTGRLRLSSTYALSPHWTLLFDYGMNAARRDDLRYAYGTSATTIDGGDRSTRSDRFLATVSWLCTEKTSLTATGAYLRGEVDQDLFYASNNTSGGAASPPHADANVSLLDETFFVSLGLQTELAREMGLELELSHTSSTGDFQPGLSLALEPVSLASFSTASVRETTLGANLTKKIATDWQLGLRLLAGSIDDDTVDSGHDGFLAATTMSIRRRF